MSSAVFAHTDLLLQIEELTTQLEQQPDDVDLLLKRGDLYRRHQSWDLARNDFQRARDIQPDNANINWFEGRLDIESGQPDEGLHYLDRFLEKNPDHVIALQNRAVGLLLLQKPLLAAEDYAAVIRLTDKPAPSLFSAHALALIAGGPDHFTAAMEVIRNGLDLFPTEISLTGTGVDILLAQSDIEAAAELVGRLPASIQKLDSWAIRKALLDCESGRPELSASWFANVNMASSGNRNDSGLPPDQWTLRLSANPDPVQCQAAATARLLNH